MNNLIKTLQIASIIIVLFSCASDSNKIKPPKSKPDYKQLKTKPIQNLNISFLLDLSDRIDPIKYHNESMEYYLRDVEYIKSVSEAFKSHLEKKKVRQMNDRMQVFFDPEPKNKAINNISTALRYNLTRNNVSLELLTEMEKRYSTNPLEIYNLAINDNAYIGSDTWGFFKTKVKDYCLEEGFRNILVILTDGYIFHKDNRRKEGNLTNYLTPQTIRKFNLNSKNWNQKIEKEEYGFIPAIIGLQNLEILVLGINADIKNPYEEDIIIKYWNDWFNKMKVGRYEIKTAGLPSNMDKIIKDFILNE